MGSKGGAEFSRTKSVVGAYVSQKGLCLYCRGEITSSNATVEHIIPRSWGGPKFGRNLALACSKCNTLKSEIESLIAQSFDERLPLTSKAALFLLQASVRSRARGENLWKARYFRMAHHLLETVDAAEARLAESIPQIPNQLRAKFL